MVPILYESNEKAFTSSGIGFLADTISCTVTEERNGVYECEFQYPVTGPLYKEIREGRIIFANHDESREGQPFVIYARSEPIDNVVTFSAYHISYRLSNAVVMPFQAVSCSDAFNKLAPNTQTTDEFTFWTNIDSSTHYELTVPNLVREVLGGMDNSLLDVYGGEYEFDKFNVKLYKRRGEDTTVEIRRGKNLTGFEHKIDNSECYNAVVPYWYKEGDDENPSVLVTLPEYYVRHGTPARIVAVPLDLSNKFEEEPTTAELRDEARSELEASDAWKISEGFEVNFVALWQTDEYKDYAPLQRVKLCDTVLVYYPEYGIDAVREKVVKTVYNTLLDRFDEITLNELPATFSGIIS